jgi:2-phosphosulfolactate phosphatase
MCDTARVHLLPGLATPDDFAGATVVVVDILRATTTIVYALAAGATRVVPLLSIEEAAARAQTLGEAAVLGGERGGRKIEGFHLGNSPDEYTPASVSGRTVVFTTTNGTRAMEQCRQARQVLIGSFANFSATCRELSQAERVEILCAGTDGQITREDVLFAGAVIDDLMRARAVLVNDQAEIAADAWRSVQRDFASLKPLAETLRSSVGGRNLIEIGHERDIAIAAEIDKFDLVAELRLKPWEIVSR